MKLNNISFRHFVNVFTGGVLLSLIVSTQAFASNQTGTINKLYVRSSDGLVFVELTGESTAKPACAQNRSYWMIKDENSATGKRQLAMLLLAQATGQKIAIYGTDQCTRWMDGEDIDQIVLGNI